ncbi:MAG: HAD-IA family hydrolase [Victivallaceae bacterium]|nr:HAD-IA family hydrolase [Victivallaceae bacterium]
MNLTHAAIFDLDGTLIDSVADLTFAVNLTRKSYSLPALAIDEVRPMIGDGIRKLIERALSDVPFDPEEALARQRANYNAHLTDRTLPYPGVTEGLRTLAGAKWRLGLFTNKPREATLKILEELKLQEFFTDIVAGGESFALKPAPDGILYLLKQFHVAPENAWMVGDHYTDLAAGAAAQTHCCLARWGIGEARGEHYEFAADCFTDFVRHVLV